MKSAQQWFDEYSESHKNPVNKTIHWICVPLILFSIIGFFVAIPSQSLQGLIEGELAPYLNYGSLFILIVMLFYILISPRIAIGMLLLSFLVLWGNVQLNQLNFMPLWLFSLVIFILAWIGQFIGHYIEGAKPSFFKDLQFLLVGPAWLMGFVYKKMGVKY